MGRKVDREKVKRGPGKKSKRQQDPVLPKYLSDPAKPKTLSSHQKKRLKKALERDAEKAAAKSKSKLPKQKNKPDTSLSKQQLGNNEKAPSKKTSM